MNEVVFWVIVFYNVLQLSNNLSIIPTYSIIVVVEGVTTLYTCKNSGLPLPTRSTWKLIMNEVGLIKIVWYHRNSVLSHFLWPPIWWGRDLGLIKSIPVALMKLSPHRRQIFVPGNLSPTWVIRRQKWGDKKYQWLPRNLSGGASY